MNLFIRLDDDKPYACRDLVEIATHLAGEDFKSDFVIKSGGLVSNGKYASVYIGTNGKYERDLSEAEYSNLRHLIDDVVFEDV